MGKIILCFIISYFMWYWFLCFFCLYFQTCEEDIKKCRSGRYYRTIERYYQKIACFNSITTVWSQRIKHIYSKHTKKCVFGGHKTKVSQIKKKHTQHTVDLFQWIALTEMGRNMWLNNTRWDTSRQHRGLSSSTQPPSRESGLSEWIYVPTSLTNTISLLSRFMWKWQVLAMTSVANVLRNRLPSETGKAVRYTPCKGILILFFKRIICKLMLIWSRLTHIVFLLK